MSDAVKQLMPPATTILCWMAPDQFSYEIQKMVLQLQAGPCVWGRMAQVTCADANHAAVKSYSALYLASGIKMTIQILNETQSKMSRKRQVIIICLSQKRGAFCFLCYIFLHSATAFVRCGKTCEKGWAEKLAHKELKHKEL